MKFEQPNFDSNEIKEDLRDITEEVSIQEEEGEVVEDSEIWLEKLLKLYGINLLEEGPVLTVGKQAATGGFYRFLNESIATGSTEGMLIASAILAVRASTQLLLIPEVREKIWAKLPEKVKSKLEEKWPERKNGLEKEQWEKEKIMATLKKWEEKAKEAEKARE